VTSPDGEYRVRFSDAALHVEHAGRAIGTLPLEPGESAEYAGWVRTAFDEAWLGGHGLILPGSWKVVDLSTLVHNRCVPDGLDPLFMQGSPDGAWLVANFEGELFALRTAEAHALTWNAEHPAIGRLTWSFAAQCLVGKIEVDGIGVVQVHLVPAAEPRRRRLVDPELPDIAEFIVMAGSQASDVVARLDEFRSAAVTRLDLLPESDWDAIDRGLEPTLAPEIAPAQIAACVIPTAVTVGGDLSGSFEFEARGLFAAAAVRVAFGADGSIREAECCR
jgi:hypothetical protein